MEWKEYKLSEIGQIVGGATPSTKNPNFYDGDIAWLTPKDLSDHQGRYISHGERSITEEGYNSCSAKLMPKGTVVFTSRAPIGYLAIAENKLCTNQGFKSLVPNDSKVEGMFAYYLLKYNSGNIQKLGTGSTFAEVSGTVMSNVKVRIPSDIEDQRKISSILSSLDSKIETNNKLNAKLEELAQTIFKSWFVDFEPFKVGADGSAPTMGGSGKMVESELGLIPEGWKVGKLSDVAEVCYGKDHKKLEEGDVPVYGSGGLMRKVNKHLYQGESVLIPRKGSLNNVLYVNETFWTVDTMFFTKMKISNVAKYLHQFILTKDLASMNVGSAVPSMTTSILNEMKIIIPAGKVLGNFEEIMSSFYNKIETNQQENQRLASLRDTLLPKLMSGEIEI